MKRQFKEDYLVYGIILIILLFLGSKLYDSRTQATSSPAEHIISSDNKKSSTEQPQLTGEEEEFIYVHISGCVAKPGLMKLPSGSRTMDAIEKAGGALPDANLDSINLAKVLHDEDKIIVSSKESLQEPAPTNNSTVPSQGKINISTATESELTNIPGIGPKTAQKIIQYRQQHPFQVIEDLKNVTGIGEKKFEQMKEFIICQ